MASNGSLAARAGRAAPAVSPAPALALATSAAREAGDAPPDDTRAIPTRDVPKWVQLLLWGKAAGRCQFAGCNRVLWKSDLTQETRNVAEQAHIHAFNAGGARGAVGARRLPAHLVNDLSNLMLVCHDCHVTIDKHDGPIR